MVKFNKYNVTDDQGRKARVFYAINNRTDGRECVTIYAKDYGDMLGFVGEVKNNTDIQSDYYEKDKVSIFKGSPLYPAALAAAQRKQ